MSDVSQGSGWWFAMDGKWYPPEQHPSALATSAVATPSVLPEEKAMGDTNHGWLSASDAGPPDQSSLGVSPRAATVQGDFVTPVSSSNVLTDFSSSPRPAAAHARRSPVQRRTFLSTVLAAIVLIGGGVLAYWFSHGGGNTVTGDPPRQVLALATSAAQKASSVHVVVSLQGPGQTASYVDDTASDSGSQVITSSGGVQVTTLVVGGTAYVKANQVGLATVFQSPAATAQRFANQWLSFGSSSQAYKPIAQSVTLSSLLTEVTPTGSVSKLAPSMIDGKSVIGIRGELPGGLAGTLYVSVSGPPLPVEEVSHTQSGTTTAIFSDWGSPVHVSAPSGAIPANAIPTLFGASGSGNDQVAQANLTNALTEAKALYQSSQSYSPGGTAMTIGAFSSSAPEFAWTNRACSGASPANCVSMQVIDASSVGDGQGVILAVYSPTTQNCWYAVDLESPVSSFTDTAPAVAFVTTGHMPTGASTPGVFYAKKSSSVVPSPSTYCSALWAATQGAFNWGLSYSSPGAA